MRRRRKKDRALVVRGVGGNYEKLYPEMLEKSEDLLEHGPGLYVRTIYHDEWCGIYRGKSCNCEPELGGVKKWTNPGAPVD